MPWVECGACEKKAWRGKREEHALVHPWARWMGRDRGARAIPCKQEGASEGC